MKTTSYVNGVAQARSAAFDAAAIATIRRPYAQIEVTWTDSTIDPSIVATANEENRASATSHAADLVTVAPYKYFLLDGTNVLDGTFHPFPGTDLEKAVYQVGWYGSSSSGATGEFSAPYPTLRIDFNERPIFGISVVGEQVLNQYPVDFDIQFYNGTSLLQELQVRDNDAVVFEYEVSHDIVTRMDLIIYTWSALNTCCKILEFYTAIKKTYAGDDIVSMNLLEEKEIRDGSLPIGNISSNEIDLILQNVKLIDGSREIIDPFFPANTGSPYSNLTRPKRKIVAYIGFRLPDTTNELIKIGMFFTSDWEVKDTGYTVETSARDRMELLRCATYLQDAVFENMTLAEIAEAVLTTAKYDIPMHDLQWIIDPTLSNYTVPRAWFEKKNYMEIIRQIVESCMGQAYMSKDDILIIESYQANVKTTGERDIEITKDDYFTKKQNGKSSDLVNVVNVTVSPLVEPSGANETVYTTDEGIPIAPGQTLTDLEIKYSSTPVTGASEATTTFTDYGSLTLSITNATYYGWGARLTINNSSGYGGTFKIQIEGKVLTNEGKETVTASDNTSIRDNGLHEYNYPENGLIQTRDFAISIANSLLASYSIERKDVEVNWRGNPALELNDTFLIDEYARETIQNFADFIVVKNKIDFDGTLTGVLSGRRVVEYESDSWVIQDRDDTNAAYQDGDGNVAEYQDGDA